MVAQLLLNVENYVCLPRLSSTCHTLHALLHDSAEQAKRRKMRWMPSNDMRHSADGSVIERAFNLVGGRPITALSNRLPTAGRSKFTVHIEQRHPGYAYSGEYIYLCLCDAEGRNVGKIDDRNSKYIGDKLLRPGTAVTFTYHASEGTLGFSVARPTPRVAVPTVLRTELESSPIAEYIASIRKIDWINFSPVALSSHLTVRPEYVERWGAAIKHTLATKPQVRLATSRRRREWARRCGEMDAAFSFSTEWEICFASSPL